MTAAPLAVVWVTAVVLSCLDGRRPFVVWTAIGALVTSSALAVRLAWYAGSPLAAATSGGWPAGLGITLAPDVLGLAFMVTSQAVLIVALAYRHAGGATPRLFPALVLFMAAGLTGLFSTRDAFNFYVFFEVSMATAFAMVALSDEPREVRAGVLFVTLNIFGSALFLLAIGGLYRLTGTLDLGEMAARLAASEARASGVGALLLAAFSLKLGLFPFHTWLPDVYRDLRPEVAAIFSGALAGIGSYGLLRFGGGILAAEVEQSAPFLLALGTVSIFYGGLTAIGARSLNAVLAYSAVGQGGYILVAVALGGAAGLAGATIYALVNAANKALLFLGAGLRGPAVAGAFACGAFSLAGVPPFAGFAAKAAVLRGGAAEENWLMFGLLVAGSALTFVYMFPAFQRRFWMGERPAEASPVGARTIVVLLAIALAAAGAWPQPLAALGAAAASALARTG